MTLNALMIAAVESIPLARLLVALIPVAAVICILYAWKLEAKSGAIAVGRMLLQLLMLGFVLEFLFQRDQVWISAVALVFMAVVSSWIALRVIPKRRRSLLLPVVSLLLAVGTGILVLVTQGVLCIKPWYAADKLIPLAGMIFSGGMNAISLSLERFYSEVEQTGDIEQSRQTAFHASLIPSTNSLLAVGLVSIPGMMTGQVLAGEAPLLAARYQIVVMCMLYGMVGLSSAGCLMIAQSQVRRTPSFSRRSSEES